MAKRRIGFAAALFAGAVLAQAALAQAPPPGVFSEVQTAVGPRISPALEPATIRSRVAQVDTQKISAARRGREILKLNLFDDAIVEVQIKRVRPTRTGYFISGRPKGMEWGDVRLVVNGPVMVGTVETPEGTFTIRSGGSGRSVIRQIDPSKESFECGVEEASPPPAPPLPARPDNAISSANPPPAGAFSLPSPQADDRLTEDGSKVRVLVVYTPEVQSKHGGAAGIRALIDFYVESANQAFEDSGINPRLVLAHSAMVNYVARGAHDDLFRLRGRGDDYLEEVHSLRDKFAADLVHLLTDVRTGARGIAYLLLKESLSAESEAFALTAVDNEKVFTHEIGHNFGVGHDRYVFNIPTIYPYAFGYVNDSAFEPDAVENTRWHTVMAYPNRCRDAGFSCERLLRFSNPEQSYIGDPLGIDADSTATGLDGPADARLTLNNTARLVGSFRSEACTEFSITPETPIAPVGANEIGIRVNTAPGCLWEASTQSEFLSLISEARMAGSGFLRLQVEANETGAERTATVTIAGKDYEVLQIATEAGICSRTSAVTVGIMGSIPGVGPRRCDEVNAEHLTQVKNLHLSRHGVTSLRARDFEGLTGLHTLLLEGNQLATLPEGVFDGLTGLHTLALQDNRLATLPEGVFDDLSNLKRLRLGENMITDLPENVFEVLTGLEKLNLEQNRLAEVPEGLFSGFPNMFLLSLSSNPFTELPGGVFGGLSKLQYLYLEGTRMARLPAELFQGLSGLENLYMAANLFTELPEGLFRGLSNLKYISLHTNKLTDLPVGTFHGLSKLEYLVLGFNRFTTLPVKTFDGLSGLKTLDIVANRIVELPVGVFDGLSSLEHLQLNRNRLSDLPAGIFSKLSQLRHLELAINDFQTVRAEMFQGLSGLEQLDLRHGELTHLPADAFTQLQGLRYLNLYGNDLNDLPEGIFSSLTSLETLFFGINEFLRIPDGVFVGLTRLSRVGVERNPVDPLPLPIFLKKVGQNQFKAIAPSGAPFTLTLPLSVSTGGSFEGDSDTATIPAGASESALLRVTRDSSTQEAISVDIATLPTVPSEHQGYALAKDETLPRVVLPSLLPTDAALAGLSLSDGKLDPVFAATTASYTATVANSVSSVTITLVTRNLNATVTYLDEDDQELTDADGITGGQQINLRLGENTIKVRVTSEDGTNTQTYTLVVTRDDAADVCSRTEQVQEAILETMAAIEACNEVTEAQLANIKSLLLDNADISSLRPGDLAGLTSLQTLSLQNNQLTSLPPGIFSGLTDLEDLNLAVNRLHDLQGNVFSDLSKLKRLNLNSNRLSSLPADVFSGPSSLEFLQISTNRLESLPENLFAGLDALERLHLFSNRLSNLPEGIFFGLTHLMELLLQDNAVQPLELFLSLEKEGDNQFKAVLPAGAPFALEIPIIVSTTGEISGGASIVTIQAGSLQSDLLEVTRMAGAEDAVTVDIGVPPTLPPDHRGYILKKDDSLPRVILPGLKDPPPAQVTGVELTAGIEQLDVAWNKVADADAYKVQWKSGEEDYDESRQALLPGGDSVSYTVTGLTPGTQYTIRVLATKENAEDGPPSEEVTGIPKESRPAQVKGVAVIPGVDELEVTWTAVSNADRYKVQWKSGEEDYDEERQAVLTGMDTLSHTIADLSGGTEYTVRVLATKDNADDGLPSEEVSGIPKATPPAQVTGVAVEPGFEELEVSWDAVSDADGYKVQWKSGSQDYDEVRQVALLGGETTSYTIIDLTVDTEYTVRVIATKEYAEDGAPSEEVTATLANPDPDVNADGTLDGDDAQVMYQAYASEERVGDGESGGTAALRRTLLSGLAGTANPSDDDLKAMLRRANVWRSVGVAVGGDINEDGAIDGDDAFVMYYAYEFADLLGDGETGGTARHRQHLLSSRANKDNPTDQDLKKMLRRANALRDEFG